MNAIIFKEESADSPAVEFNTDNRILKIQGKSLLENTFDFYLPLLTEVNRFVNSADVQLNVEIQFDYLNSSTSRYFMELLMILENSDGNHLVKWYYEEGDDVIYEKGLQFQSLVEINFEILSIPLKEE